MKKLATLLAASLLIGSALAIPTSKKASDDGGRHWVINVGLFQPTGDHNDLGVDSGFTASFDRCFGNTGSDGNSNWFVGLGAFFGDGDNDLTTRSWGLHVGVVLGLGKEGDENPWAIELKGGWYQTRLEDDNEEDSESGFGGSLAIVYKSRSSNGHGVRFAAGWYTLPEVRNVDNTGYFFTVGFPIGGK